MIPNTRQRKGQVNRDKPHRRRAARAYDAEEYRNRGRCEGIFGAEEARGHRLHCRFIREDNQRRFAKGRAIAWNVPVLGRFMRANRRGMPIPSYGGAACA